MSRLEMNDLAGMDLGSKVASFTIRDALLYNLTVGAPPDDLELVYERGGTVLPTFGCALGLWAVEACGDLGAYDRFKSLHVGQQLKVIEPLLPGDIEMRANVTAVWDKGSAAIVEISVDAAQFQADYTIFVPGAGGWGGDRGPTADKTEAPAVSRTESFYVPENWAALYRLTGDMHPVHIDPEASHALGLDRPILHGLCTLGIVARMAANTAELPPLSLSSLSMRMASPVYPGDTLEVASARQVDSASDGSDRSVWLETTTSNGLALSGNTSFRVD